MNMLIREGYEVERNVQEFFESNGTATLYEIKSSTSIKTDSKHNHIKDACFQKFVLNALGSVSIVYF